MARKSIWAHEPILTPERKVWRAVLEQAYLDSEMTMFADATEAMEKERARRFLRADGVSEAGDLHRVCDFADVPMDRLVLWARRRYLEEQTLDTNVECGSHAPAFSISMTAEPQKRQPFGYAQDKPGCRTP